jgi:Putative DNA-binding domain
VSTLLDYSLAVSVMRNATEADIDDVFGRINTYGHRLSDQERRQAGVENAFSDMVRILACRFRGDVSEPILSLQKMPSISIDLPKTKQGYLVRAEEVFWVRQGILRSTDLRDSMDEQCIADITSSIVSGNVIERSREALDEIYQKNSNESNQILSALEVYGPERVANEFAYCVDEILKVCEEHPKTHLRGLIFKKETTNPFPSVFAIILIAFHELLFKEKKQISNYKNVKDGLTDLNSRIQTTRKSTSPTERRKNINVIKGLVGKSFVRRKNDLLIGANHASLDVENIIRRSEVETANYELKQGLLELSASRRIDPTIIEKVNKTICAIANNGSKDAGKLLVGVTDKSADTERVKALDGITAQRVANRYVVGVAREAVKLNIPLDKYVTKWRDGIKNSSLSEQLKSSVLANFDYNNFYGLGVLIITIPPQKDISYYDNRVFFRSNDETIEATTAQQIANVAKRF